MIGVPEALATANAALTTATTALLIAGYRAIKRRDTRAHRARMIGAFSCSAVFLVLFTIRFALYGFRHFDGTGAARVIYYVVLIGHEPIAVLSVPLGLVTFGLGLFGAAAHKELAPMTLGLWLVSSITGIVFYAMLYVVT